MFWSRQASKPGAVQIILQRAQIRGGVLNKLEINVNSPLGILLQEMSKGIVRYNVSFSPAFYIY